MKSFNVTGLCVPDENYMADISGKISQIRKPGTQSNMGGI